MTFGFLSGSRNFLQASLGFLWSLVFCTDKPGSIEWARSCTTTAYRWLFRDSQLSLRTLWSAVIKSPKITARGTASPLRLLHGALVILVLLQISQFQVFREMSVDTVLTLDPHVSFQSALKRLHEKNWRESLLVMEFRHPPNSPWILEAIPESQDHYSGFPRSIVVFFLLVFGILLAWVSSGVSPIVCSRNFITFFFVSWEVSVL